MKIIQMDQIIGAVGECGQRERDVGVKMGEEDQF